MVHTIKSSIIMTTTTTSSSMKDLVALLLLCFIVQVYPVAGFEVADGPPLLNSPVFSLATTVPTRNPDNAVVVTTTNMNIVTYASPMSIRPTRLWAIGLYKETASYENFKQARVGVLQLLTADHISLVRLLGGTSGRDVDKQQACRELGFEWKTLQEDNDDDDDDDIESSCFPLVLPGCKSYLCLELVGDLIDGGSHDIAICRVTHMFTDAQEDKAHLETQSLRELGIITAQGRVADE